MLIGELSEQTGVSRRALRYYEEQGLLLPERASSGYRTYSADAVLIVAQIRGLYASGLDSDAVRAYLPCARGSEPQLAMCGQLRRHLQKRAQELPDQMQRLQDQRDAALKHLGDAGTQVASNAEEPAAHSPSRWHPAIRGLRGRVGDRRP